MFFQITTWIILGPWMKLVDIFIVQKKNIASNEKSIELENFRQRIFNKKPIDEEEKSLREYLFGKYSYTPPEGAYTDRYIDRPLLSSSAKPFPDGKVMFDEINRQYVLYGSRLDIDMIPRSVHMKEDASPPKVKPMESDEISALSMKNSGQSYNAIPTEVV